MPVQSPLIRPMLPSDMTAILAIQRVCYALAMNESATVMQARLERVPACCWVATDTDRVIAYLMAYPSRLGQVTPLGHDFSPATEADCLYLHDLAVLPSVGRRGVGQALVRHALGSGGWPAAGLVCVQDALPFWLRQGFIPGYSLAPDQTAHLTTYPTTPCYLVWRAA